MSTSIRKQVLQSSDKLENPIYTIKNFMKTET